MKLKNWKRSHKRRGLSYKFLEDSNRTVVNLNLTPKCQGQLCFYCGVGRFDKELEIKDHVWYYAKPDIYIQVPSCESCYKRAKKCVSRLATTRWKFVGKGFKPYFNYALYKLRTQEGRTHYSNPEVEKELQHDLIS